jgi:E3 ubiquitin-protein ligase TRIP12
MLEGNGTVMTDLTTGVTLTGRSAQRPSRKPKKTEQPPLPDPPAPAPPRDDSGSRRPHSGTADRQNSMSEESNGDGGRERYDDDDDDERDPFEYGFHRRHGLPGSIRALSGMLSGTSQRLRNLLEKMRQKDPTEQLLALTELSELLLVSTEDNLAGHFSPDAYVKELVTLMQPDEIFGENPEIMLLACRCLANLMEALPSATANVVYGGAVTILCQKLLEIHYIDLAEQAISTLEKISVEFPTSIVREGGLTAILTYLDFFPTGTQRTAVTTAANCCRNIPNDSFSVVRDVMPILLNVLNSADQKVLEQGCLCVSRIVQSFKYDDAKLEELVSEDMLKAILRLLLPGTTNLISSNIHTQFLSVLANTARASPRRSVDLLKMSVVDTLYQILTGVSPPSGNGDDVGAKIDSVVIMQALIHRPRDQIFETLNVICELLPNVQSDGLLYLDSLFDAGFAGHEYLPMSSLAKKLTNDKRLKLFKECKEELKRFTIILLPTLTDAYSSTVNLSVRQKVLTAQLKMLSNIDTDILESALRNVSYSSFLASILTQQDHPTLVTFALQAAELLLKRLGGIYRYQFYREGVIFEIAKLAERPLKTPPEPPKESKLPTIELANTDTNSSVDDGDVDMEDVDQAVVVDGHDEEHSDDEGEDEGEHRQHRESTSSSDSSSDGPPPNHLRPLVHSPEDTITMRAKKFIETHESDNQKQLRSKAEGIRDDLKTLTEDIKSTYLHSTRQDGLDLLRRLADYFDADTLHSVTSYELLSSKMVEMLLDVFTDSNPRAAEARTAFLEAFMGQGTQTKEKTANSASPATPFSAFVHKLQELLSRAEHFEVITVGSSNYDSNRGSAAGLLAKTLKIRLKAEDGTNVPEPLKTLTVSIQAIATLKALDDYLRPRIMLGENPRRAFRDRDMLPSSIAAYAAALASRRGAVGGPGGRSLHVPPPMPTPSDLTDRPPPKQRQKKASPDAILPPPPAAEPSSATHTPLAPRRSARRSGQPPPVSTPKKDPAAAAGQEEPLECADETQLMDEDDIDDDGILNAMVDRLHSQSSEDEEAPAVNMEIASTGKVTARKEDGTRIATPLGSQQTPSRSASGARLVDRTARRQAAKQEESTPSRPSSYAAALQVPPTDWHLEFTVNGQPVALETTVYRAVHFNQERPGDVSARNIWHDVHTVAYKKVAGPYTASTLSPPPESPQAVPEIPNSLEENPTSSAILRLLSLLHGFNANIDDILAENKESIKLVSEPSSQFVNTKLTAKMNRQLEEPLIVASNCLPSWSEDLARLYPFLFPFETRHLFLQSTSFGYSRSMSRWQMNQQNGDSRHDRHRDDRSPFLGRTQRQKIRISRQKMLESAMKVMDLYGSSPSILEVEYFEEVGTGLGPTLEFYSTVSKEFAKKKLKLWRENESQEESEYAFGRRGLFPAPMSEEMADTENGKRIVHMFTSLGKFVARSMLDSRIIDLNFNPTFFRIGDTAGAVSPSLGAIGSVDNDLANSLKLLKKFSLAKTAIDENAAMTPAQKVQAIQDIEISGVHVEDMALDFTLPGYPSIELVPGGSNMSVTIDNVAQYMDKVLEFTLGGGVSRQVEAFRAGFSQVFPYISLHAFTPDELVMLFGRVDEDWSLETLMDSIKADHGFNLDSRTVRNLLAVLSGYSMTERRNFLQFVTGSPKLPIGGKLLILCLSVRTT